MHWGNIGSALAGLSTVVIAVAALIRGPGALRDWRARQRAQAEAAHEEAKTLQLDRRRGLSGWNAMGVNTYPVALVTAAGEFDQARAELTSGRPTAYVVLRVTGATEGSSANLAPALRQTIEAEGYISRAPTAGECEALEKGLEAMSISHAGGRRAKDAQSAAAPPA